MRPARDECSLPSSGTSRGFMENASKISLVSSKVKTKSTASASSLSRASTFFAMHGPIKTVTADGSSRLMTRPQAIIGEMESGRFFRYWL
jgi:hypothetical protein